MQVLELFNTKYEKGLQEGSVDQPGNLPVKQPVKGQDVMDPRQKMAQLKQAQKKGPLANVGAGLKAFFKGEPEPMDEQGIKAGAPGATNQRAIGNANMALLMKANAVPNNYPVVNLMFGGDATEKLDKNQIEIISDYYDGLADDNQRNHFIYNILSNRDQVIALMSKLGAPISVQKELPLQGELPLSEKKKFKDQPDLTAGTASDVKVARELQKLRAKYPGAKSDLEALARSEIDTSERSTQQLDAIRGANEKQDALLKQLVALDREQGQEINNLDQENTSLEKQLAHVQATNDRLQQTLAQMTGTKKSSREPEPSSKDSATAEPISMPATVTVDQPAPEPAKKPRAKAKGKPKQAATTKTLPAKAFGQMARQISQPTKLSTEPAPPRSLRASANDPEAQAAAESRGSKKLSTREKFLKNLKKSGYDVEASSKFWDEMHKKIQQDREELKKQGYFKDEQSVDEHGGGIGPRQHWQSLMKNEGWSDKYGGVTRPPTPYGVYIDGRQWKVFPTDDQARAVADKVRANLKRQGRDQKVTIGPSQEWLKGDDVKEAKEIVSKEDFVRERDRLLRMISQETNPANKQILRSAIRQLENRAENEGWISLQSRMVRQ